MPYDSELDQVRWSLEGRELVKLSTKKRRKLQSGAKWTKSDVYMFQNSINDIVKGTAERIAPLHVQFGGVAFAVLILIAATIIVSVTDEVLGGLLMFAVGVIVMGASLWYRTQLMGRIWKRIAAELQAFFKAQSEIHEGMQFEFHIQGHHQKKNKKGQKERRSVWYERYIILTLPAEDHIPRSKRMSFTPMVSKKLQQQKDRQRTQHNHTIQQDPMKIQQQEAQFYETPNGVRLAPWWAVREDAEGRTYYINNLKKCTTWKPPTQEQLDEEEEEMNAERPPPAYDASTKSKKRFEEVKRRSLVKRTSLIKIQSGNTKDLKDEDLIDVKPADRPKDMAEAPYSGHKRKKKDREAPVKKEKKESHREDQKDKRESHREKREDRKDSKRERRSERRGDNRSGRDGSRKKSRDKDRRKSRGDKSRSPRRGDSSRKREKRGNRDFRE